MRERERKKFHVLILWDNNILFFVNVISRVDRSQDTMAFVCIVCFHDILLM